jgi:hypothetical protein
MIVNLRLGSEAGKMAFSYQLELAGLKGKASPNLQVQGAVAIRPGSAVRILECGSWTMDFALDAEGKTDPKSQAGPWSDQGLGNWRLTMDLAGGGGKVRCRHVIKPGSQGNIVDSTKRGGKKVLLILNHVLAPAAGAGTASLEYQLEYTPAGGERSARQERKSLSMGREFVSETQGYRLGFLLEGTSAPAAAPAAAPAPTPDDNKAIPLLR